MPDLKDVIGVTPLLLFFIILAIVIVKLGPNVLSHRKEIKVREFDVRQLEATVSREQAQALEKLSASLGAMSSTLRDVAIEQRRATDTVKMLQRVNTDSTDQVSRSISDLNERLDRLETGHDEQRQKTGAPAH